MRSTPLAPPAAYGLAPLTPAVTAAAAAAPPRRVTDDCNREWTVRELPATARRRAISLLFQCTTPGVRPEVRRAARPLHALDDGALLDVLGGRRDD